MLAAPALAPAAAPPGPARPDAVEPPARPSHARGLPREAWSFALALAAVLVVKAGLLPNVPW